MRLPGALVGLAIGFVAKYSPRRRLNHDNKFNNSEYRRKADLT
jgi:hypothetical protein